MTEKPTIHEALNAVMLEVTSVEKSQKHDHFRFDFRGIEQIMTATGPAFRRHGIIGPTPRLLNWTRLEAKEIGAKDPITIVEVEYTFTGPAGDKEIAVVPGESKDTTKAMSVAERIALIQVLHIPTGERDPDAPPPVSTTRAKLQVRATRLMKEHEWDREDLKSEYYTWSQGAEIEAASDADLEKFLQSLEPKQTMRRSR